MVFFVLRMLVTIVMSTSLNLSLVEGKVPQSCSKDADIHHVIGECQSKEVNGSHVHLTSKLLSRASFSMSSCRKLPSFKICQVTETNDVVTSASVVTTHSGTTALKEMTPADTITTTDEANTTPTVAAATVPEATRIVTIEAKATQKVTTESKSTRKPTTEAETTRPVTRKTDTTQMVSAGAGTTQMATTKSVTTRLVTTETDTTRMESTKADTTATMTTATKTSKVTTGATTELTTETTPMLTTTVAEATTLSTTPLTTVSTTPVVTTTSMKTTRKQTTTKEVETTTSTSTSVSPTTKSPQPELLIPSCDLEPNWNSALSHCDQLPEMSRRLIVPFNMTFILHIIDLVNQKCGTDDYIWLDCERNVQYGDMMCRDPTTSGPYDRNAWVKISDLYGESPDWRNSDHLNGQGCLAVKMENGQEKFFSNSCNSIGATTVCMLPC